VHPIENCIFGNGDENELPGEFESEWGISYNVGGLSNLTLIPLRMEAMIMTTG
jgi:hypothetical protein